VPPPPAPPDAVPGDDGGGDDGGGDGGGGGGGDGDRAGLARWLGHRHGTDAVAITGWELPSSGYASHTVLVEAGWPDGDGRTSRSLVLRTAPLGPGTFADYDVAAQWRAQRAAAAAGVPVADPVLEEDPSWIGRPFVVMERIAGHLIGSVVPFDPWLASLGEADRTTVATNLFATLARIHRADRPGPGDVPHRDNGAELDHWEAYLDWSTGGAPVPTLTAALGWCRAHRPGDEPGPVLLWGDVRPENLVVGDDLGVRAVLDWDMASVGAPGHDLAWFTALDATMEHLVGRRLAGWPDRGAAVALYQRAGGRTVADLDWYETLALVRSAALMTRIGVLRRDAGLQPLLPIDDNPVLDLVRRRTT